MPPAAVWQTSLMNVPDLRSPVISAQAGLASRQRDPNELPWCACADVAALAPVLACLPAPMACSAPAPRWLPGPSIDPGVQQQPVSAGHCRTGEDVWGSCLAEAGSIVRIGDHTVCLMQGLLDPFLLVKEEIESVSERLRRSIFTGIPTLRSAAQYFFKVRAFFPIISASLIQHAPRGQQAAA